MTPKQPGKLGNPEATLASDPRTDPRIATAMAMFGELAPGVDAIDTNINYELALKYCAAFEDAAALSHPMEWQAMPDFPTVSSSETVIKGADGNDITLFIHQPAQRDGTLPCLVHTHGGGMVLMTATDPVFVRWRNTLAAMGMVVVGVEFRNGGGKLGNHPFPAGLNDCASAVQWTHENRSELDISTITISGESGGGNLSIATTLKAKQEGWGELIDGVYAFCPYISGAYQEQPADLPSLKENDGYLLSNSSMQVLVKVYDPELEHTNNPLAWPLQASVEDLKGLPPHVVSMNELDPLRDEGIAFLRKLQAAGVSAVGKVVLGTGHAGDLSMPDIVPEIYQDSARALYGFAKSLKAKL